MFSVAVKVAFFGRKCALVEIDLHFFVLLAKKQRFVSDLEIALVIYLTLPSHMVYTTVTSWSNIVCNADTIRAGPRVPT